MIRMQLVSRRHVGATPYEARIIHGPFALEVRGFKFEVVTLRANDDSNAWRSVVDVRSGCRIGNITLSKTKTVARFSVQQLLKTLIVDYGECEVRKRIEGAPSLTDVVQDDTSVVPGPV